VSALHSKLRLAIVGATEISAGIAHPCCALSSVDRTEEGRAEWDVLLFAVPVTVSRGNPHAPADDLSAACSLFN
jgi:hypothetical protein